jgi:hypothetical protein
VDGASIDVDAGQIGLDGASIDSLPELIADERALIASSRC